MAKTNIEVSLSEVALRLRDSGAFRAALLEVANEKAKGEDIDKVTITAGQRPGDEFAQLIGGAGSFNRTVDFSSLSVGGDTDLSSQSRAVRRTGFADTTW